MIDPMQDESFRGSVSPGSLYGLENSYSFNRIETPTFIIY
jgi:hypothetical protein